ncbi:uncharacterized protein EMH_0030460 [Eimeria mitis]|uniref:Transmembrane protein n=1 Tax=Eimeria mitis TaxID=44415 RepID=U6K0V9_9EIME|nr:uncharacterized protein EMH_0030460 [Eimeria mitis]CDJ30636.1 hypothetical protein, conserved [Eimeria mitis]
MDAQPHLHVADLQSASSIGDGIASNSEGKASYSCGDGSSCIQRIRSRRTSYPPWFRILFITLTSLAVVYFLLRCFELVAKTTVAVEAKRSLAVGGRSACEVDTSASEDEEEQLPAAGFEGAGVQGHIEGAASGETGLESGGFLQWEPWSAYASYGAHDWFPPLSSAGGNGVAASKMVPDEHGESRNLPVRRQGSAWDPSGQRMHWGDERELTEQFFSGEVADGRGGHVRPIFAKFFHRVEDEGDLWEGRRLPPYAAEQVESIYERMLEVIASCRRLQQALSGSQFLLLTHSVMRLLALDLGAISVIPEDLERLRSGLGDALVQLGSRVLQHTDKQGEHRKLCTEVQSLIHLTRELTKPRQTPPNTRALTRMKKMATLIRTAGMTVKMCSLVLSGLSSLSEGASGPVPENVVEQQIRVLEALFTVHSNYIFIDNLHKHYIVLCQAKVRKQALFGPMHYRMTKRKLPSLNQLLNEISEAVDTAGGLLLFSGTSEPPHHTAPSSVPATHRQPEYRNWQPHGLNIQAQMEREPPPEFQPPQEFAGHTLSPDMQIDAPLTAPAPESATWWPSPQPLEGVRPAVRSQSRDAEVYQKHLLQDSPSPFAPTATSTSSSWMRSSQEVSAVTGSLSPWNRPTMPSHSLQAFEGSDVGAFSLHHSPLEHGLALGHGQPTEQSRSASDEARMGLGAPRSPHYRGLTFPDATSPAPWSLTVTDHVLDTSMRGAVRVYEAEGHRILQHQGPEQTDDDDSVLSDLLKGVLEFQGIFPKESDKSSPE